MTYTGFVGSKKGSQLIKGSNKRQLKSTLIKTAKKNGFTYWGIKIPGGDIIEYGFLEGHGK